MKHIKSYKIFESASPNFPTTKEEVIEVCKKYRIDNYTINDDLSIDVDGNVVLYSKNLEYLPLKFNYVSSTFICSSNKLESLEGSPQIVGGDFSCYSNNKNPHLLFVDNLLMILIQHYKDNKSHHLCS